MLLADALQTRGDVWTSIAVIVALAGARAGVPILDPIAALVVAGFIGRALVQIAATTTRILSDRVVMSEADIERVVMNVPGVLGCHQIRTRGSADHVFLDFHVWLPPTMPLVDAHALSHVVKDRLMAKYPQIADAVIHLEPPPATDVSRVTYGTQNTQSEDAELTELAIELDAGTRLSMLAKPLAMLVLGLVPCLASCPFVPSWLSRP